MTYRFLQLFVVAFLIVVCQGLPFSDDKNNKALLSFGAEESKLQDYLNLNPRIKRQTGSESKSTDLCSEDKLTQVATDLSKCEFHQHFKSSFFI